MSVWVPSEAQVDAAIKAYNTKRWHTNMSGDAQRSDMTAALIAAWSIVSRQQALDLMDVDEEAP